MPHNLPCFQADGDHGFQTWRIFLVEGLFGSDCVEPGTQARLRHVYLARLQIPWLIAYGQISLRSKKRGRERGYYFNDEKEKSCSTVEQAASEAVDHPSLGGD